MSLSACRCDLPLLVIRKKIIFFHILLKMRTFQWPNLMKFFLAIHIWQTYQNTEFQVYSTLFVEVINLQSFEDLISRPRKMFKKINPSYATIYTFTFKTCGRISLYLIWFSQFTRCKIRKIASIPIYISVTKPQGL